ncbi:MAG: molecular chaperone DnaJ, partial [Anaeromyxobacteraceae bacterium]
MKPLAEQTLYEILEVPFDAPDGEILRACERVQALFGPGSIATYSLIDPDEVKVLGKRIDEARSVLLDPVARADYDDRITAPPGLFPAEPLAPAVAPLELPPPQPVAAVAFPVAVPELAVAPEPSAAAPPAGVAAEVAPAPAEVAT